MMVLFSMNISCSNVNNGTNTTVTTRLDSLPVLSLQFLVKSSWLFLLVMRSSLLSITDEANVKDSVRRHNKAKSNKVEIAINCKGMQSFPSQQAQTINDCNHFGNILSSFASIPSSSLVFDLSETINKY